MSIVNITASQKHTHHHYFCSSSSSSLHFPSYCVSLSLPLLASTDQSVPPSLPPCGFRHSLCLSVSLSHCLSLSVIIQINKDGRRGREHTRNGRRVAVTTAKGYTHTHTHTRIHTRTLTEREKRAATLSYLSFILSSVLGFTQRTHQTRRTRRSAPDAAHHADAAGNQTRARSKPRGR